MYPYLGVLLTLGMRSDRAFIRAFLRRGVDDIARVRFETIEPTASGGYRVQSDGANGPATTTIELHADHARCTRQCAERAHHRFIDASRSEIATVHRFFASGRYRARVLRALVRAPPITRMLNACLPCALRGCDATVDADGDIVVVGRRWVDDERDPIVYTTAIALIDDDDELDVKTWRAFRVLAPSTASDDEIYAHAHIPVSVGDVDALRRYVRAVCPGGIDC